jgi:hypothetical protein
MRLLVASLLVALAACGGSQDSASTTPAPAVTEPGEPAAGATGPVDCASEIALECGAGMVDGCMAQLTTHHACVAEEASAGPPCEQEIALECPEGQIDACLATPQLATTHVCVAQ